MSIKSYEEAADRRDMESRIIRVDCLPDQAGIAAALKRAFAPPPPAVYLDDDDPFALLLKAIN